MTLQIVDNCEVLTIICVAKAIAFENGDRLSDRTYLEQRGYID